MNSGNLLAEKGVEGEAWAENPLENIDIILFPTYYYNEKSV